jgi:hypothetical protein
MTRARQRQEDHIEAVSAVLRRSAYRRVLEKIAFYERWQRDAAAGSSPLLDGEQRRQLAYLLFTRALRIAEDAAVTRLGGADGRRQGQQ